MESKAYDRCANCHHEFADHDYVKDSIDEYKCPVPHQETGYGFFNGGDPRKFHPDRESCSAKEIDNHRRACQLWDEAEARGETPDPEKCPSGWIYHEHTGEPIAHVLRAPYGIGCYTAEFEQFWEPMDATETVSDDDDLII